MSGVSFDCTPLLAHVAGVPVEEMLPGVLALGAASVSVATEWVRRRLSWRKGRDQSAESLRGRSR